MGDLALLVPLAPFLMVCFIVWTKHQRKMAEMQLRVGSDEAQTAEAFARLEERVRVLERIVTDRGSDLAAQIEALREEAPRLESRGQNWSDRQVDPASDHSSSRA